MSGALMCLSCGRRLCEAERQGNHLTLKDCSNSQAALVVVADNRYRCGRCGGRAVFEPEY